MAISRASAEKSGVTLEYLIQGMLCTRGGGVAIAILTHSFFERRWPLIELACLVQLHQSGLLRLRPICVGITMEDVKKKPFVSEVCPDLLSIQGTTCEKIDDANQVFKFIKNEASNYLQASATKYVKGQRRSDSFENMRVTLADHLRSSSFDAHSLGIKLGINDYTNVHNLFDPKVNRELSEVSVSHLETTLESMWSTSSAQVVANLIPIVRAYRMRWLEDWSETLQQFVEQCSRAKKWAGDKSILLDC